MMSQTNLPDFYRLQTLRNHIDRNLDRLFCHVQNMAADDQQRLLAHIEDWVGEEVGKLMGSIEVGK